MKINFGYYGQKQIINAVRLAELKGVEPIEKQGQVRWYKKPQKGQTYMVALDPSLGTGGDNAAIQILELPSLKQVAEWMHNKTPVQQQIAIMREICGYLAEVIGEPNDVYYSVENNTLGEAALVTIADIGEENIPGIFLNEPRAHGNSKKFRRGFNTTHKSKLSACAKLKNLVESGRLEIQSKNLITELKGFTATGNSYSAKPGEKDDLVMSLMLAIRMINVVREFDASIEERMKDNLDDIIEPMPFIMM
jgi:hypothetical protein